MAQSQATKSEMGPSEAARRRQRGRNWALCAALSAMVVIFYVLTFVTLGGVGR
ncbi:MAG: hypothetical protein ACTSUD_06300 [Alphaproteobacteria bacterium]